MQLLLAANVGRNIQAALCHENSSYPPAFTQNGHMYTGTKSDILQCLREDIPVSHTSPETTAIVLDGAVIVQMLSPKCGNVATFQDYAESVFIPYILQWLQRNERVDVVFDVYSTETASLKQATRDKRGNGIRLRVTKRTKVPKNWQSFLRVDANKQELFKLLADEIQLTVVPQVIAPMVHVLRNLSLIKSEVISVNAEIRKLSNESWLAVVCFAGEIYGDEWKHYSTLILFISGQVSGQHHWFFSCEFTNQRSQWSVLLFPWRGRYTPDGTHSRCHIFWTSENHDPNLWQWCPCHCSLVHTTPPSGPSVGGFWSRKSPYEVSASINTWTGVEYNEKRGTKYPMKCTNLK